MEKKVLFIANHAGFSKFNAPYFAWFRKEGWTVHNASPGLETGVVDCQYDVPIARSPFALCNLAALRQLWRICRENQYDAIHCHTPVGGVLGRICGLACRKTNVIYTAHGFHFFRGASWKNWLTFYPVEKLLSWLTDCIVTINDEDFQLANRKFHAPVFRIDGVGVNLQRFVPFGSEAERIAYRENLGLSANDFVIIYVAQFMAEKNHPFLFEQILRLRKDIPELKVLLAGSGGDFDRMKELARETGVADIVQFLGYRTDVEKLYAVSDLLVSVSQREGFGINLVEGMACGLPVVCSNVRGHRDILSVAKSNILFEFGDNSFAEAVLRFYHDKSFRKLTGMENQSVSKFFSVDSSVSKMAEIYRKFI